MSKRLLRIVFPFGNFFLELKIRQDKIQFANVVTGIHFYFLWFLVVAFFHVVLVVLVVLGFVS